MPKSFKRERRESLGKSVPLTPQEYELREVIADVVDALSAAKQTPAMIALRDQFRAAEAAHPKRPSR